jgi:sulfite exporter TauE/SafE
LGDGKLKNKVRGLTAAVGVWVALTAVLHLGSQLQQWSHILAGALIALVGAVLARRWEWDGVVAMPVGVWLLVAGITRGGHAGLPVTWINLPAGVLVSGACIAALLDIDVPWAVRPSRSR